MTTIDSTRPFAIALGANLGEPRATIQAALGRLEALLGPLSVAPLYLTEPISPIPQPDYLNTVVLGRTDEAPETLLDLLSELEIELGRAACHEPDAPREIDLDLLFVGELERSTDRLVLPHPRLRERRFVLAPLADLAPDLALPPDGETVVRLLARLPDRPRVERLTTP